MTELIIKSSISEDIEEIKNLCEITKNDVRLNIEDAPIDYYMQPQEYILGRIFEVSSMIQDKILKKRILTIKLANTDNLQKKFVNVTFMSNIGEKLHILEKEKNLPWIVLRGAGVGNNPDPNNEEWSCRTICIGNDSRFQVHLITVDKPSVIENKELNDENHKSKKNKKSNKFTEIIVKQTKNNDINHIKELCDITDEDISYDIEAATEDYNMCPNEYILGKIWEVQPIVNRGKGTSRFIIIKVVDKTSLKEMFINVLFVKDVADRLHFLENVDNLPWIVLRGAVIIYKNIAILQDGCCRSHVIVGNDIKYKVYLVELSNKRPLQDNHQQNIKAKRILSEEFVSKDTSINEEILEFAKYGYKQIKELKVGERTDVMMIVSEIIKSATKTNRGQFHHLIAAVDPSCLSCSPVGLPSDIVVSLFMTKPVLYEIGDVLKISKANVISFQQKARIQTYPENGIIKYTLENNKIQHKTFGKYEIKEGDEKLVKFLFNWWSERHKMATVGNINQEIPVQYSSSFPIKDTDTSGEKECSNSVNETGHTTIMEMCLNLHENEIVSRRKIPDFPGNSQAKTSASGNFSTINEEEENEDEIGDSSKMELMNDLPNSGTESESSQLGSPLKPTSHLDSNSQVAFIPKTTSTQGLHDSQDSLDLEIDEFINRSVAGRNLNIVEENKMSPIKDELFYRYNWHKSRVKEVLTLSQLIEDETPAGEYIVKVTVTRTFSSSSRVCKCAGFKMCTHNIVQGFCCSCKKFYYSYEIEKLLSLNGSKEDIKCMNCKPDSRLEPIYYWILQLEDIEEDVQIAASLSDKDAKQFFGIEPSFDMTCISNDNYDLWTIIEDLKDVQNYLIIEKIRDLRPLYHIKDIKFNNYGTEPATLIDE